MAAIGQVRVGQLGGGHVLGVHALPLNSARAAF